MRRREDVQSSKNAPDGETPESELGQAGEGVKPLLDATDAELMQQLRAGDERALETIMRTYADQLFGFALRRVRSPDVARDMVQDIFVALWEARARLDLRRGLAPYLFRSVHYRCLNTLRHARVEEQYESRVASGEIVVEHATADPWDGVDRAELYAELVRAVQALPPNQQTAVSLRWGAGLPYAAVAARMNLSVKGVEFHMRRALAALRAKLGGAGSD
jgi:RNA polymerase sigma-70 factor, ECF subfamily